MSKYIAIILLSFSAALSAQARDVKSEIIFPKYQQRPILALLSGEKSESAANQVTIIMGRAARICDFLGLPAGSFRSRHGERVLTMGFAHDGKLAALEKIGNGSINPRLLEIAKTERPDIVKSMVCVGSN
ncbi:MAG: hypothetical protein ACXWQO_02330 [Bdellovibrionota bacterium]